MPLHLFYLMIPGKAPIPVHHKGYMLGYRSLPERAYEEFAQLKNCPFGRRRLNNPFSEVGEVQGRHTGV